jgi:hypothetical protein
MGAASPPVPSHVKPRSRTVADDNEDDLENAVFHEHHALDLDAQTNCLDGLLCCLRSRCLSLACVVLPCLLFLLCALATSWAAHPKTKLALFVLAGLPPVLYVCSGLLLVALACCQQLSLDTDNAQAAHRYLQARSNLHKIAVTAGKTTSEITVAGRRALFFQAASDGDLATLQWCLDNGQHVDETDAQGRTALHVASRTGADETVVVLLRNGASLDVADALEGFTPLHYAAFYGHLQIVRLLTTGGADLLRQDARKLNPLQLCEMASLALASVQPAHQLILTFLRIAMKDDATPPLQHTTGLTVVNLVERQRRQP